MGQLRVTAEVRAALQAAAGPVELVSEQGTPIGTFTPGPICPWDPTLTHEEIERIANEPGGCTLDEIWRELGVK